MSLFPFTRGRITALPNDLIIRERLHTAAVEPVVRHRVFDWMPSVFERTFTLFPKLPIELRIHIWKLYDTEPRAICFIRKTNDGVERYSIDVFCKAPLPVLLRTSQESRNALLKNYKCVLKDTEVYINLATDIVYFSDYDTYQIYVEHYLNLRLVSRSQTERMVTFDEMATQLQHLVIDDRFDMGLDPRFDVYTHFRALRSLVVGIELFDGLLHFRDSRFPDLGPLDRWEFAWRSVGRKTGPCPVLMLTPDETMKELQAGEFEWHFGAVERGEASEEKWKREVAKIRRNLESKIEEERAEEEKRLSKITAMVVD